MFPIFVLLGCLHVVSCQGNILNVAKHYGANELVNLINSDELRTALSGKGPYTLFAPTDQAFNEIPKTDFDNLKKNKELLKEVLSFHVANGTKYSSQLRNDMTTTSLEKDATIRFNKYGKVLYVDGCKIILPDNNASNGVVHMIDKVMYPVPKETVVGEASETAELSTLVYAIIRANMQKRLEENKLTVFAPNNEAFQKLPAGKLTDLLNNETALTELLEYHVVSGTRYSMSFRDGLELPTLFEKKELRITKSRTVLKINEGTVTQGDVSVSNGVIHVIDTVLIPPE